MERCTKCGSQKILKNDVLECIFCAGKKQGVAKPGYKPPVDPGEASMKKLLNGVKVPAPQQTTSIGTEQFTFPPREHGSVNDALRIMETLPMPSDMKQFKQIIKIIGQLEKLIEVQQ